MTISLMITKWYYQTEIRLTLQLFAVAASAEAGKFVEAIDTESVAAVEAVEVPPPPTSVTVAVAIACPGAHRSEVIVCIRLPLLCLEGKGTRSVGEEVACCVGDIAVAERHVLEEVALADGSSFVQ